MLAFGLKAANDTLTRAQVYNFNVGDTFDYKIETINVDVQYGLNDDRVFFSRIVINDIEYFQVQDSLAIIEERYEVLHNNTLLFQRLDTLKIGSTSVYQISYDSILAYNNQFDANIDTGYNNRIVNIENLSGGGVFTKKFASGLGKTMDFSDYGDGDGSYTENDTTLIYYSQAGETWGVPATIAVGISNISELKPVIELFPTVNNGQFKLKLSADGVSTYQFTVYDITGRELKEMRLTNNENDIDIKNVSAGVYLWRVKNGGQTLQTGKFIVQH